MNEKVQNIIKSVDTSALIKKPLNDWRPILARECQVFVCGENYIAKRFDQINYKFCAKDEAKEVLIDNLYALLRYKYFPKSTEEIDDRIDEIIKSFTTNLKTTLVKVSFDKNSDCEKISFLPDSCIAFRNGVFDFKKNDWLFKYDTIKIEKLSNIIYLYDPSWAIMWYMDYNFDSLDINLNEINLKQFISVMKEFTKSIQRNYCFELMYNMSHTENDIFSEDKFLHLCEIMGYTILQSFSQHFVMLIGSGQNGKNSLFDGCFSDKIIPKPASNDLSSIETDRFITGSLENKAQNIFLETSGETQLDTKMLKALTGSMYQTIQPKGINKYSGIINCKYIFAANDQEKTKFKDNTPGFRRRINMFEIWYHWDSLGKYLKTGDYYDTKFSDSLSELKDNPLNVTAFIYFGMYGIMNATKNFTKNFEFTLNDWNESYTDVDDDLKEKLSRLNLTSIVAYMTLNSKTYEECKYLFFDCQQKVKIYNSDYLKSLGYDSYEKMINMLRDPESSSSFFAEKDVYVSVRLLQNILRDQTTPITFSSMLKKIYSLDRWKNLYGNKPYVKCTFVNRRLKILKE